MYAIIKTGGKQYRVKKGDVLDVELLETDDSGQIVFDDVLFLGNGESFQVGAPRVEGASVVAQELDKVKGPKVISYKFKRRKNYHRKIGHRQRYSRVEIQEVRGA